MKVIFEQFHPRYRFIVSLHGYFVILDKFHIFGKEYLVVCEKHISALGDPKIFHIWSKYPDYNGDGDVLSVDPDDPHLAVECKKFFNNWLKEDES